MAVVRGKSPPDIDFEFIGQSPAFRQCLSMIRRFARCDAPVLIEGETGTGKELAARVLHCGSERRSGAFVAVNVAALPEALLANELFGHEDGAFTGSAGRRQGLIEQAEGGTLFLDEIDGLPMSVQASLLRFLQDLEYRPLGGGTARTANIRILCASNADLPALVSADQFREDLFYRINVLSLKLPPLRNRSDDLEPLADLFLTRLQKRYGGSIRRMSASVQTRMRTHTWPGNVRELENRLHRGFLLSEDGWITEELMDLPNIPCAVSPGGGRFGSFSAAKAMAVASFERDYIETVLRLARGNVSEASRLAEKERRSFARLIEKHGIDRRAFTSP